jgi:malonate decarboxylase delta subunit
MEQLRFTFDELTLGAAHGTYALAGVVASGDLEILVESAELDGRCEVEINTSVHGYEKTWQAVMQSFVATHPLADTRVTVNDGGATPAVVSLRFAQATQLLGEGNP